MNEEQRKKVEELAKRLTDEGRLMEVGWLVFDSTLPLSMSEARRRELRKAFYLGAQHVFASITDVLDPGKEPTERDIQRMTNITEELEAFRRSMLQ